MLKIKEFLRRNFFWELSFFIHLFLLLSFSFVFIKQPIPEKKPALYIPAFVYHSGMSKPVMRSSSTSSNKMSKHVLEDTDAIKIANNKNSFQDQSELKPEEDKLQEPNLNSLNQPNSFPVNVATNSYKRTQPVHLIGEKLLEDPLIKLLGIAVTAHLVYPRVAQELRMRGVASVGFLLLPSGEVTNVRLMKSSNENVLDTAALNAINEMSPVNNVNMYLKEPKFLVFNIIFR